MLVNLVRLRHQGKKRPAADVQADAGQVGEFSFSERARYVKDEPVMLACALQPGTCEYVTPPLDRARITQIRNGAILVTGAEQVPKGRKDVTVFKQTWWCRPIAPSAKAEPAPADPGASDQLATYRS
ncbi:hypothetical protein [Polaromonas sp.]|uniref:hypothetical protein n=1 Tax=Polaromonas sp. TaxID=1869339 RepID=UPI0027318074|nr:hypothetical protein [Polaromonas sp.]